MRVHRVDLQYVKTTETVRVSDRLWHLKKRKKSDKSRV